MISAIAASSRPSAWQVWWAAARPRTLPAALAPVLAASALAWRDDAFLFSAAAICLAFALLVQIGTNFANDYFDFVKGADTAERVGPRRAVASGWVPARTMKRVMAGTFALAFLVGLALWPYGGWPLLVVGLASILCGIVYTGGPYPLAYHGWGDVFVFVFFGWVAVGATYFVQAGRWSWDAGLIGAAIGGLATNILVVNNYRDAETDARAGKRTLVVRWGRRAARGQFAAAWGIAALVPALVGWRSGSAAPLLAWSVLPLGWRQSQKLAAATTAAELITLLGDTGRALALYAVALAIGLIVG